MIVRRKLLKATTWRSLRGAHPDGDEERGAALAGLVEAVQLAVVVRRARGHHIEAHRRHVIAGDQRVDDVLPDALHAGAVVGEQGCAQRRDVGAEVDPGGRPTDSMASLARYVRLSAALRRS